MFYVDKETIYQLYVIKQKPMRIVADEMGIAVGSVYNYLRKYGIETREQGKSFLGKTHTEETRAKISKANKGRVFSEETRNKMSESKKVGGIGHKKKRADGYICIYFPDHPKSNKEGYIMEHDLIMECLIGRHLHDDEVVHHKNKKRDDNRKENLELMTFKEHSRLHMIERHEKKKGGMTY